MIEILTLEEAANFLRVSKDKLEEDAIEGRVPCHFVGGEWRFTKQRLFNWFNTERLSINDVVPKPGSQRPPAGVGKDYDEDPEEFIAEIMGYRTSHRIEG